MYSKNIIFHQYNNSDQVVKSELFSTIGKQLLPDDMAKYKVSVLNGKLNLENIWATNFNKNNDKYFIRLIDATNTLIKQIQIRPRYYGPIQFLRHINTELSTHAEFTFNDDGSFSLIKAADVKLQISPMLFKYFRGLDHDVILLNDLYTFDLLTTESLSIENNRSKFYTWVLVNVESNIGSEKCSMCSNTKDDVENYDILMSMIVNNKNEDAVRNLIYVPDVLRYNNIRYSGLLANVSLSVKVLFENGEYENAVIDPGSCNLVQLQFSKE